MFKFGSFATYFVDSQVIPSVPGRKRTVLHMFDVADRKLRRHSTVREKSSIGSNRDNDEFD